MIYLSENIHKIHYPKDVIKLSNERFKNLVIIIFNQTLGILPYHNERNESYKNLFPSYQLGRDLKKIEQNKPLPNPGIYISAINDFFNSDSDICIEKITQLIELLVSKGYIKNLDGPDILSKCDRNTMDAYHKLILDIWNHYYTQYSAKGSASIETYSMSKSILDTIIQRYTKFRLPVTLDFYRQRIPDIIELLRTKKPGDLYESIKTEYIYFFKNVLDNKSFYTLSHEERMLFMNTLYAISDILDKVHHKDSYRINLEILDFFNRIHCDDFTCIGVDDIRKIQGCIYAIAIETTNESIQGNIKLTRNGNLIRVENDYQPITQKEKLDMCDKALRNLLKNQALKKLDSNSDEELYINIYENRLQRNRTISIGEINELYVLSLLYSNISVCTLQYIKQEIDISTKYNEYVELCEDYHKKSRYIRTLIVRITKKIYGEKSTNYIDSLHFLAAYYHSVATRYFYMKKYAVSIAIRSVLYTFYMTLGLKEKARVQLDLAPIALYEENSGGNAQLYSRAIKPFFESHKKDFSYLYSSKIQTYEDFKELVNEYHIYKRFL